MRKSLFLIIFIVCSFGSIAKEVLWTAVSPEFSSGLHAKYLSHMAEKLGVELRIELMPLARRLRELENGKLDVLVMSQRQNDNFYFITPAYENIPFTLYIRKEDDATLTDIQGLKKLVIGHSIGANLFADSDASRNFSTVTVSSLDQKIRLLILKRIDAFFHAGKSVETKLEEFGKISQVRKANFQPEPYRDYYFVISKESKFFKRKLEMSDIVSLGLESGVFQTIRQKHYIEL